MKNILLVVFAVIILSFVFLSKNYSALSKSEDWTWKVGGAVVTKLEVSPIVNCFIVQGNNTAISCVNLMR